MRRVLLFIFLCVGMVSHAARIGLLVVATGNYTRFVSPLLASARNYFCKNHEVTYFIFTDGVIDDQGTDVVVLPHRRYGWPFDTLFRYLAYAQHHEQFSAMDYMFSCDADMLFVDHVGDEILSDRVGTVNPGYVGRRGPYEQRPYSSAYVNEHEGEYYFAGGFYGGKRIEFLQMLHDLIALVDADLKNHIIAVWHDESYLNRYFIDHKPTLVLPRPYCARPFDYPQKLIALDKNHAEMRKQ